MTDDAVRLEEIVAGLLGKPLKVTAGLQQQPTTHAIYFAEISTISGSGKAFQQEVLQFFVDKQGSASVMKTGVHALGTVHVDGINETFPDTLHVVYKPLEQGAVEIVSVCAVASLIVPEQPIAPNLVGGASEQLEQAVSQQTPPVAVTNAKKQPATIDYVIRPTDDALVSVIEDVFILRPSDLRGNPYYFSASYTSTLLNNAVSKKRFARYGGDCVRGVLVTNNTVTQVHTRLCFNASKYGSLRVVKQEHASAYIQSRGKIPRYFSLLVLKISDNNRFYLQSDLDTELANFPNIPLSQNPLPAQPPVTNPSPPPSVEKSIPPESNIPQKSHVPQKNHVSSETIDILTYEGQGTVRELGGKRIYVNGDRWFELKDSKYLVHYSAIMNTFTPQELTGKQLVAYKQKGAAFLSEHTTIAQHRVTEAGEHSEGGRGIKLFISQPMYNKACMAVIDHLTEYTAQGKMPDEEPFVHALSSHASSEQLVDTAGSEASVPLEIAVSESVLPAPAPVLESPQETASLEYITWRYNNGDKECNVRGQIPVVSHAQEGYIKGQQQICTALHIDLALSSHQLQQKLFALKDAGFLSVAESQSYGSSDLMVHRDDIQAAKQRLSGQNTFGRFKPLMDA